MTAPVVVSLPVCDCCGQMWWPETVGRFPELCGTCTQWFALLSDERPAGCPVFGPARSVRALLTGNNVTVHDYLTDTSLWVLVNTTPEVFTRMGALIADAASASSDASDADHIPARRVIG